MESDVRSVRGNALASVIEAATKVIKNFMFRFVKDGLKDLGMKRRY